ncbi:hypothetical protein FLAG1_03317 [Fusarium langsethiae]|uniref:Uncharacterized protein n=1 Tax=Fusarium langsethiae TaxID=179993 RepID=A0A0M9F0T0_FUSLA|nr:hypothetical protein FLAG1_03317 [Fusarium langsethiae]GKU01152.1 unnamed protein product [Fusarium langsethiae]
MAIIFEDQLDRLDKLTGGEPSQFSIARSEVLEPAFDSYIKSFDLRERAPPPSTLQLIGSPDIKVKLSRCGKSGAATDLTVTRTSDPSCDNFMGYCKEHECVVFKGETGLLDDFLDFVESAAVKHKVNDTTVVLKAPDHVRVPFGGLEYGLKYEEFVDRVEVLQCAVWIRTSPSGMAYLLSLPTVEPVLTITEEQQNGGKTFVEIAIDSQTPPPSTPEYVPTSPDTLIAYKASLEHQEMPSQNLSDSDSPLSSCGTSIPTPPPLDDADSGSSADSSELSDPPALIYTPPWLRDLNE